MFKVFLGLFMCVALYSDNTNNTPPFSIEEVKQLPKVQIQPNFIKSSDDLKLAYYAFLPEHKPLNSVIIFYHGSGIYSNNPYQYIGAQLQKDSDIGIYFVDTRGHGNSEGPRGDTASIEAVYKDIDSILMLVQQQHPNTPIFLAGHSSGAGLVLNYCDYNSAVEIKGLILIAPFLGPNSGTISPKNRFIKHIRSWVYMLCGLTGDRFFTHIPCLYFNYSDIERARDPKILEYYTYAMSRAVTPLDPKTLFANLTKPFALYVGQEEEAFIPEKVIEYKDDAINVKDQSYATMVPGAKHISILVTTAELIRDAIEKLN